MAAPARIERPYRVRFDEAGPDGRLRSSGYLRFAQDLAWLHSESAGFDREWYEERGLTWLIRAIELDIRADVPYGEEVVVSTQVTGFRRVWARRRSEFRPRRTERPVAVATTDWVILNARGVPTRVPADIAEAFAEPESAFTPLRLALPPAPENATTMPLTVRRSELDPMAHVNNAAYIDYLDEQYLSGPRQGSSLDVPRRYSAEFIASAEPGANLCGRLWLHDAAWLYRLEDDSGKEMLRARLETDATRLAGA